MDSINRAIAYTWLLVVSVYLFMMQTAFGFMAVGCSRLKNNQAILANHVIFVSVSTLTFIFFGHYLVFNGEGGLFGFFILDKYEKSAVQNSLSNEQEYYNLKLAYCIDCLLCTAISCT